MPNRQDTPRVRHLEIHPHRRLSLSTKQTFFSHFIPLFITQKTLPHHFAFSFVSFTLRK